HGFGILRGGTLRVTAAAHRVTNYVRQYEKCDPTTRRCRFAVRWAKQPRTGNSVEPVNAYKILNRWRS
ncbi:MAG: hypothetical protein J7M30_14840, partial [Deltaproteobacteria bacterium]|nr:hypothetical protein [Deltaproteobacteria bacterium]